MTREVHQNWAINAKPTHPKCTSHIVVTLINCFQFYNDQTHSTELQVNLLVRLIYIINFFFTLFYVLKIG